MTNIKNKIIENLCYTELVYERINKKLSANYSKKQIELFINEALNKTNEMFYIKIGKNYYVSDTDNNLRITINSNTFRVITVDVLKANGGYLKERQK